MAGDDLSEGDARARIYECFSRTLGIHNAVAAGSVTVAGCPGGGGEGGQPRARRTDLALHEGHRRPGSAGGLPRLPGITAGCRPQPTARRYRQQPAASRRRYRRCCRHGSVYVSYVWRAPAAQPASAPPVLVWCRIRAVYVAVSYVSRSRFSSSPGISVPGRPIDLSCAHSEHSDNLEMWELGTTRQ